MGEKPLAGAHDRLLVDAAPPVEEPSEAELDRAWNRIAGAMQDPAQGVDPRTEARSDWT
jgi:hypothetical protein